MQSHGQEPAVQVRRAIHVTHVRARTSSRRARADSSGPGRLCSPCDRLHRRPCDFGEPSTLPSSSARSRPRRWCHMFEQQSRCWFPTKVSPCLVAMASLCDLSPPGATSRSRRLIQTSNTKNCAYQHNVHCIMMDSVWGWRRRTTSERTRTLTRKSIESRGSEVSGFMAAVGFQVSGFMAAFPKRPSRPR